MVEGFFMWNMMHETLSMVDLWKQLLYQCGWLKFHHHKSSTFGSPSNINSIAIYDDLSLCGKRLFKVNEDKLSQTWDIYINRPKCNSTIDMQMDIYVVWCHFKTYTVSGHDGSYRHWYDSIQVIFWWNSHNIYNGIEWDQDH